MTRPLVLFAALILGACTVVPIAASPSPSSALPTPEPKRLDTLAPDDLRVFAVGEIPADSRYVYAGETGKERILLVDPVARRVSVVAQFEGLGAFLERRSGDLTTTPDRRTLVLTLSSVETTRVYVMRPEDATVSSFTLPASKAPRISPDGRTIALARSSDDPAAAGVWLVDVASGRERRVIEGPADPPSPVQWSPDGRWLSLFGFDDGGIGLFDARERVTKRFTPGLSPRFRTSELFYGSGASLLAYDVTTAVTRTVYAAPEGMTVRRFELRPKSDGVAAVETAPGKQELWLRGGDQERLLRKANNVISMWWSDDGAHLYVWDSVEATTSISDALSGEKLVDFCLRGDVSPPCS